MNMLGDISQSALSVIKDPFNYDSIEDVNIYSYKPIFDGERTWKASVSFANGNTKGKQETPPCKTFDECLIHLKEIFKSIGK